MMTPYLRKNLCENFCPHFRPSKKQDLACKGFLVVEALLRRDRKIFFEKICRDIDETTRGALIRNMCTTCPFYENDCDFVRKKEESSPCGGFMLLGALLGKNSISIDDIRDIV